MGELSTLDKIRAFVYFAIAGLALQIFVYNMTIGLIEDLQRWRQRRTDQRER